jgi:hypothetical protein
MWFPGANGSLPEGNRSLAAQAHFLIGPPTDWHTSAPLFGGLEYKDLYPGIDLAFGSEDGRLKSEFRVSPGCDPGRIRIAYGGADSLSIERDGVLSVRVNGHIIREQAPLCFSAPAVGKSQSKDSLR